MERKVIQVKSFPVKLWQQMKIEAVRQELTMGMFIARVMRQYLEQKHQEADQPSS